MERLVNETVSTLVLTAFKRTHLPALFVPQGLLKLVQNALPMDNARMETVIDAHQGQGSRSTPASSAENQIVYSVKQACPHANSAPEATF
jgi:hypothetical protein